MAIESKCQDETTGASVGQSPPVLVHSAVMMRLRTQKGVEMKVEYKVRPVTRYIVTCYREDCKSGSSETKGEFSNGDVAYQVAYALAKNEHNSLGYPPGDERIQYPKPLHAEPEQTIHLATS